MTKLLLVEDDKILQESIQECLKLEGFEVIVSGSLEEARKHLEHQPDLIILDWMLSDGQGIEILSEATCFDVCDILRLKLTGYVDSINLHVMNDGSGYLFGCICR